MSDTHILAADERWMITEQGRKDLLFAQTCFCTTHWSGLLIECPECGTVYGYVKMSLDTLRHTAVAQ